MVAHLGIGFLIFGVVALNIWCVVVGLVLLAFAQ